MSLSTSTLNAIQKVGAAAFIADEKLKKEVQSYAERVNTAMVKNPYNLGNDALIEGWKAVARLSKSMMGIEEELKNIHRIASELTGDDQPSVRETPALAAPVATVAQIPAKRRAAKKAAELPDTTAVKAAPAKAAKKVTEAKPKATAKETMKAKTKKSKAASAPVQAQDLKGNSAKLMAHLQGVLNATDFADINQSAVAKDAGIAVGSMGATLVRLIKAGRIVSGTNGRLKLTTPTTAPSVVLAEPEQIAPVAAESTEQA